MPDDCDPEVFEIVGGKSRQNASVDRVLAKGGFILAQTDVPERDPGINGRLHSGNWYNRPRTLLCKGRSNGFTL
jgi:hypothetical protein